MYQPLWCKCSNYWPWPGCLNRPWSIIPNRLAICQVWLLCRFLPWTTFLRLDSAVNREKPGLRLPSTLDYYYLAFFDWTLFLYARTFICYLVDINRWWSREISVQLSGIGQWESERAQNRRNTHIVTPNFSYSQGFFFFIRVLRLIWTDYVRYFFLTGRAHAHTDTAYSTIEKKSNLATWGRYLGL